MAKISQPLGWFVQPLRGQALSTLRALDQKLQPLVEQKRKIEESKMLLRGILSERFSLLESRVPHVAEFAQ